MPTSSGNSGALIGITGLCCAGKNYIAGLLEAQGFSVLDVDFIGHLALDEAAERILERWGREAASSNDAASNDAANNDGASGGLKSGGRVNRGKLAKIVFKNPAELAALEAIIHPIVNRRIAEWINSTQGGARFINAALLHKCDVKLDAVLLVKAPFAMRVWRAKKRDSLSFLAIIRRFAAQKSFYKHYKSLKKPLYVVNNGFLELLKSRFCGNKWTIPGGLDTLIRADTRFSAKRLN